MAGGVPLAGGWKELLSSDEERFGGSGKRNPRKVRSRKVPCHGQEDSIVITVPPLEARFSNTWDKEITYRREKTVWCREKKSLRKSI